MEKQDILSKEERYMDVGMSKLKSVDRSKETLHVMKQQMTSHLKPIKIKLYKRLNLVRVACGGSLLSGLLIQYSNGLA
jgi:hypothetical protein